MFFLTLPFSTRLVIITMTKTFCSQTILQNASNVESKGPCNLINFFVQLVLCPAVVYFDQRLDAVQSKC